MVLMFRAASKPNRDGVVHKPCPITILLNPRAHLYRNPWTTLLQHNPVRAELKKRRLAVDGELHTITCHGRIHPCWSQP